MKLLLKYTLFTIALFLISCGGDTNSEQTNLEEQTPPETQEAAPNTLTDEEKASGWELLFDGKSADKWRGYNKESFPDIGWKVENGMMMVIKSGTEEAGYGGDIITKGQYENFEFSMDFLLTDTANSGILYLVKEEDGVPIWHNAPEYQLLDDKTYATMGIDKIHFTAANYDIQAPNADYTKPIGEWNNARIIVNNGHVEHWLNGNKAVEYDLWTPEWEAMVAKSKFKDYPDYGKSKMGHIGIQDHGHTVQYQNLKIRKIGDSTGSTQLFNGKDLDGWAIHGTEKWYVEDGLLVCESGPDAQYGYLATNERFKDMDLTLEFKQEADGNSGVFFRSSIDGTKITGWQAEVAPPGHDTGGVYESYGRGWLIKPDPSLDKYLKMGDWNKMRVKVVGDEVTTWLNGHQMINLKDDKIGAAEGQIALQIHDGGGIKVRWRNIAVKRL